MIAQGLNDAARAELEELRAAGGGFLLAEAVVERARSANSALHSYFEWDDSAAAAAFRLQQARTVIRAVVRFLPSQHGPRAVRAYVSLQTDRTNRGGGYRAIADVLDDDALAARATDQLMVEMARLQTKFGAYVHLRPALAAMAGALEEIRTPIAQPGAVAAE